MISLYFCIAKLVFRDKIKCEGRNYMKINRIISGFICCLLIAIPCNYIGKLFPVIGGPVLAILTGMILGGFIRGHKYFSNLAPGIKFTSKYILQLAVVLLGFGMNLNSVLLTGKESLPIIVSTISVALIISYIIYKLFKMPSNISTLIGVGSSICGGSAIAATAPVIGAEEEEIAQAISVIFLFNVIAALIFPSLGQLIGFSDNGFGLFAGTAVNDTSSVTAAASAWDGIHGSNTLDTAAIVKMTRTLAIIPITVVLAFYKSSKSGSGEKMNLRKVFPVFILFFVLASVITTFIGLPEALISLLKSSSKFFIVMAMAGIGINTDIVKLIKTGAKPILMGALCWISIALTSIGMQIFLDLM